MDLFNNVADLGGGIDKRLSDLLQVDFRNTLKMVLLGSFLYITAVLLFTYSVSFQNPTEANFTFGFLMLLGISALVLLAVAAVVRVLVLRKN